MTPEDLAQLKKDLLAELAPSISASVKDLIVQAVNPIAEQQRILADTLMALPPAGVGGGKGDKKEAEAGLTKFLTAEDLIKVLNDRDARSQQSTDLSKQRDAFVGSHMAKLPAAYKAKLGNDPTKWADEAKNIHTEFETDFRGLGGKLESIGNVNRDGGDPAAKAKPDLSKLSALQKIEQGMKSASAVSAAVAK